MSQSAACQPTPGEAGAWRKARRCQNGECIEVLRRGGSVMIRDSADPEAVFCVDAASWRAFAEAIKAGEFDDLG